MPTPRTRGLALITVLWLISLLTLLATAVLAITRNHGRISSRTAQIAAAEIVADSAIRFTLLQINAPLNDGQPLEFSANWPLKLFDQTVNVEIEREAGRVDLNSTDASLLAAVFMAGGIDAGQSASFASRIIDWRHTAPFETVGELRQVPGLADLKAEVLDAFTVYSTRSPTIVLEFAHPLVRVALNRLTNPPVSATTGPQLLIGQVARIRTCASKDVVKRCRVAIARVTGNRQKPFMIYSWYTE
jgi:type II secretory pathway component PulK